MEIQKAILDEKCDMVNTIEMGYVCHTSTIIKTKLMERIPEVKSFKGETLRVVFEVEKTLPRKNFLRIPSVCDLSLSISFFPVVKGKGEYTGVATMDNGNTFVMVIVHGDDDLEIRKVDVKVYAKMSDLLADKNQNQSQIRAWTVN